MDEDFPELPEDDLEAFIKLEAEFRQEYEAGLAELAYLLPRPPSDMAV